MSNNFKNDEQRRKWNQYNTRYSKINYKTITVKLHRKDDADIVAYLDTIGESMASYVKKLIRQDMGK